MTKECASGPGARCKGYQRSIDVHEATIRDYTRQLQGTPSPTPDAKVETIGTAAELLGRDGKVARAWVTLIDPLLVPLLLELAAILCGVVAFGPRFPAAPRVAEIPTQPSVPTVLESPETPCSNKEIVGIVTERESDQARIVEALKQRGGEVYSQRHLSIILQLSPAEVCRMLKRCDPAKVEKVWNPQSKSNVIRLRG